MTERRLASIFAIGLIALLTLMPVAAGAAQQTAEPAMLNMSWWWEDYQGTEQDIQGNKIVVETPSPFCPTTPGSTGAVPGACAEGRIPIEIRGGDYDSPVMLAGVGFDLSMVTPGSEVTSFTVTFLEAEPGCYDQDKDGDIRPDEAGGDHCEQTGPQNIDGHKLQACLLTEIIGDAEARPYAEVPRYTCSDTDPLAERKEVPAVLENKDDPSEDADGIDHVWTFDLTQYAQEWAKTFTVSTAIMLVGNEPDETGPQDSWRVVLAGAKTFKGIRTKLVYEPAEFSFGDPTDPGGGTTTTGTGSVGDFTGGSASTGGFGSTTGGTPTGTPGGTVPDPGASPSAAPGDEGLAAAELEQQGMPGYVALALLAGLIGFFMVRQVVIESTAGIRPDGVLAKIHALNAERRGVEVSDAAAATGGLGAAFSSIGRTIASPFKKLPFFRKG
jgi:hypothetical protein